MSRKNLLRVFFIVIPLSLAAYHLFSELAHDANAKTPHLRTIYFKLPLRQPEFHWVFEDRAGFLSGDLTMTVMGKDGKQAIPIFHDGKISDAWRPIEDKESKNEIYFGFTSKIPYLVSSLDQVDLLLALPKDVPGIGPDQKGVLKSGEYRSRGKFTVYWTDSDTAFLRKDDFDTKWDLTILQNSGWMADRK